MAANAEVSRYQERHGAIVPRRQVMNWLDGTVPDKEMLTTPLAHMFSIETGGGRAVKRSLAL